MEHEFSHEQCVAYGQAVCEEYDRGVEPVPLEIIDHWDLDQGEIRRIFGSKHDFIIQCVETDDPKVLKDNQRAFEHWEKEARCHDQTLAVILDTHFSTRSLDLPYDPGYRMLLRYS